MENAQQEKEKKSFGFKPNWPLVSLICFLVFIAAFLGGFLSHYVGSGIITKKIKSLLDMRDLKMSLEKSPKKTDKKVLEESNGEKIDPIAQHREFRDRTLEDLEDSKDN